VSSRLDKLALRLVRGLAITFWLVLALLGGLRLWQSLALQPWLLEIKLYPGSLYLALTGAAQMLVAFLALAALFAHRQSAGLMVRLLAALWMLGFWIDRIWVASSPAVRVNDAFVAVFLAFWLLIIWTSTSQQK
jgi:hypothetical protein